MSAWTNIPHAVSVSGARATPAVAENGNMKSVLGKWARSRRQVPPARFVA
jgi:hypothetical protein